MKKDEERVNAFYKEFLQLLNASKLPYLLGGGFAINHYTNLSRITKDIDIFCKAGDFLEILKYFGEKGFKTELTDLRWLGKVYKEEDFIDIIYDSVNSIWTVNDLWFEHSSKGQLFGLPVRYMPAEELIWCKLYVQNRERYDGADLNHIILKYGHKLNWKRLADLSDQHWELLLGQLLNFIFVYPGERNLIPSWLFDHHLDRLKTLRSLPLPLEKVCRGPLIDQTQYKIDITEWEFKATTIKTV